MNSASSSAEQFVELLDCRDRGLADADRADRLAFDQLDFVEALEQFSEQRGGHPTCRATTDDENLAHLEVGYRLSAGQANVTGASGKRPRRLALDEDRP